MRGRDVPEVRGAHWGGGRARARAKTRGALAPAPARPPEKNPTPPLLPFPTLSSTLDPALRREFRTITPQAIALAAAALAYLGAKPGVLEGAIDFYVADPLGRALARGRGVTRSDLAVGRRIATGGFGSVFRATLAVPGEEPRPVILKKASEFGPAEAWMNERCARGRATRRHVAAFVAAFDEADGEEEEEAGDAPAPGRRKKRRAGPAAAADGGPLWLVWEDEGGVTLADLLARRDWPACAEGPLFGAAGTAALPPPGPRRRAAVLRALATQLFEALDALHGTGIVHRDVKPQNLILLEAPPPQAQPGVGGGEGGRALRLIDLGAAADLRVGINYTPNEVRRGGKRGDGKNGEKRGLGFFSPFSLSHLFSSSPLPLSPAPPRPAVRPARAVCHGPHHPARPASRPGGRPVARAVGGQRARPLRRLLRGRLSAPGRPPLPALRQRHRCFSGQAGPRVRR